MIVHGAQLVAIVLILAHTRGLLRVRTLRRGASSSSHLERGELGGGGLFHFAPAEIRNGRGIKPVDLEGLSELLRQRFSGGFFVKVTRHG